MEREQLDAGDAVAFSVEMARPQRHTQRRSRAAPPLPQCVVRVERRRSDRQAWDCVLDEATALQSLNYVSRLERHRFEYRLSLGSCTDPLLLALPTELWVPRVQTGRGYQHPHIGTFRLIKTAPRPAKRNLLAPSYDVTGRFVLAIVIVAALASACFLLASKCKIDHESLSRWWKQSVLRRSMLLERWKHSFRQTSKPETQVEAAKQMKASRSHTQPDFAVFEDMDEVDEPDVARELLMPELPDFNDESGWRDFFESQIYKREDRPKQSENEECSVPVRLRTLITRSSNNSDTRRPDRPTRIVTAPAMQPIYSVPTRIDATSSQAPASVFTSRNATSLRHQSGSDFRSETATSSTATAMYSSRSTQPQSRRWPSSPGDDFGEFWQM